MEYKDPEGKVLFTSTGNKDEFTEGRGTGGKKVGGRSEVGDEKFCVSMFHAYEFKNQMPCPTKNSTEVNKECSWSYAEFVPTNCENYMATICQHEDADNRKIIKHPKHIFDGILKTCVSGIKRCYRMES